MTATYPMMRRVELVSPSGRGALVGEAQSIDIDVDVQMTRMESVRGSAPWGRSIGTSGITGCQARVVVNSYGAMIHHYIASDTLGSITVALSRSGDRRSVSVPDPIAAFSALGRPFLDVHIRGSDYSGQDWRSGTSCVAVLMPTNRQFELYAFKGGEDEPEPKITFSKPKPVRQDSSDTLDSFANIDWAATEKAGRRVDKV